MQWKTNLCLKWVHHWKHSLFSNSIFMWILFEFMMGVKLKVVIKVRIKKNPNSGFSIAALICWKCQRWKEKIKANLGFFEITWRRNDKWRHASVFLGNNLSAMGDNDVLVGINGQRPVTVLAVAFEPRRPVRREQSPVLGHAQRLPFLAGCSPILRDRFPAIREFLVVKHHHNGIFVWILIVLFWILGHWFVNFRSCGIGSSDWSSTKFI